MIRRMGRFMEHFWLAVTIASMIPAGVVWYRSSFADSRQLWLISSLCLAMWLFRRFTRKRMEAWEERQNSAGGR